MARTNALNIKRLSKYNFKYISLEEIIVLEYLISYFLKNILHQVVINKIETETGLRRSKIMMSCEKLVAKGFIEIKNEHLRKEFSLDLEKIETKVEIMFLKNYKYGKQYIYALRNPFILKSISKKKKLISDDNIQKIENEVIKPKAIIKLKNKSETESLKQMSLF